MRRICIIGAVAALGSLSGTVWAANAATVRTAAPKPQPLLHLRERVVARAGPSPTARAVGAVEARTPLTAVPSVLPILQSARGPSGGRWLRVRLPMRPNGVSGWVPAYMGKVRKTSWRIVVHRSERRAIVFEGKRVRAEYSVVVGRPSTPTPIGGFFVVEKIRVAPGVTDGPWALATSAYSNVLYQFAGGPGQIALHGTVGLYAPLGTSSSNGCVRFGPDAISWIATHVDNGTPVVIRA